MQFAEYRLSCITIIVMFYSVVFSLRTVIDCESSVDADQMPRNQCLHYLPLI